MRLTDYLENIYHKRVHTSTNEPPMERYLKGVHMLRKAPKNLNDHFRLRLTRKVAEDRTVRINKRFYEAPVGLVGQKITLLLDDEDPSRIEVLDGEASAGFLIPLNQQVNSKVSRDYSKESSAETKSREGGSLFERRE